MKNLGVTVTATVTAVILCYMNVQLYSVEAATSVDCKNDLMLSCVNCYKSRNLEVSYMPNVGTDPDILMHALLLTAFDPLVQCRFPDKYKAAVMCVLSLLEYCANPPAMANSLPDSQRLLEGMDATCTDYYTMNADCVKQNYERIMDCSQKTLKDLLLTSAEIQAFTTDQFSCLASDVNYDCVGTIVSQSCDEPTANAYRQIVRLYSMSRVCLGPEHDPARPGRLHYTQSSNGNDDSSSAIAVSATSPLFFVVIVALAGRRSF